MKYKSLKRKLVNSPIKLFFYELLPQKLKNNIYENLANKHRSQSKELNPFVRSSVLNLHKASGEGYIKVKCTAKTNPILNYASAFYLIETNNGHSTVSLHGSFETEQEYANFIFKTNRMIECLNELQLEAQKMYSQIHSIAEDS